MSYDVGGTNDAILSQSTGTPGVTTYPFTIAGWFQSDGWGSNWQSAMSLNDTGSGGVIAAIGGTQNAFNQAGAIMWNGASWVNDCTISSPTLDSTTQFYHMVGIYTSATDRAIVLDGDWSGRGTGSTSVTATGINKLGIGGQYFETFALQHMDGQVRDCAVWNVALTQPEVEALAAGASPLMIRPESLQIYAPLRRNVVEYFTGPLQAETTLGSFTADNGASFTKFGDGEFQIAAGITGAVTGTAVTGGVLESEIVAGGETIILTLTNDTWVASGATFDAQRQNIIDGLDAASSPTNGWNNEVRDNEVVGAVVRTSDTVVTITLSAAASYSISGDETVTVTIPATALVTSSSAITASPTILVSDESAPATPYVVPQAQRNVRHMGRYH